jgi:hypothetical protein
MRGLPQAFDWNALSKSNPSFQTHLVRPSITSITAAAWAQAGRRWRAAGS